MPISSIQRWIALGELNGLEPSLVLSNAGISPEVQHADYGLGRTTAAQFRSVIRTMLEATQDELLARGPSPVPRGTAHALLSLLVTGADLGEAMRRIERFAPVFPGLPPAAVETSRERARISVDTTRLDDPNQLLTDIILAVLHRGASWLIGQPIALTALEFPYPAPERSREFEVMYGLQPTFGHERAALAFPASLLHAPVVRSQKDVDRLAEGNLSEFIVRRDFRSSTSDQVRSILANGLSGNWPTAEDVAAKLSISAQHLRRRLSHEETSLTQIRKEILRDEAIASLTAGVESIGGLSARLGFSEVSAFRRAFRRWTGSPPSAYRPAAVTALPSAAVGRPG